MFTQIADFIGPETQAELVAAFGSSILLPQPDEVGVEDIESVNGLVTGQHVWYKLWLFGIVVDNDVTLQRSCGDLWRPDGKIANGYYVPDDEDSELSLIDIDHPPTVDVAWDSRP